MKPAQSFLEGLRRPGGKPILCGLLIAIGILVALEFGLRSSLFRFLPEDRFLASKVDQFTRSRFAIARLASLKCGGRCVYLVGGSSLREAIENEVMLSKAIRARTGEENRIVDLSFFKQTTGEAMALIERIPEDSGLVVVATNAHRFTTSPQRFLPEDNYLLTSAYISAKAPLEFLREQQLPIPTLFALPSAMRWLAYYFDSRRSELGRLLRPAKVQFQRPFYDESTRLPLEKILEMATLAEQSYVPAFAANAEFNARALQRLVKLAQERDLDIALIDQPFHPLVGEGLHNLAAKARDLSADIAREAGIPFWNFAKEIPLRENDFQDIQHLIGQGRDRMQEEIAERIASWQNHRRERHVAYGRHF